MNHTFPSSLHRRRKYPKGDQYFRKFEQAWKNMIGRCYYPNASRYECYGGRGIRVCRRWHEFSNFFDDMYDSFQLHANANGGDTQLDRINSNDHYYPENCQWLTRSENIGRRGRLSSPLRRGVRLSSGKNLREGHYPRCHIAGCNERHFAKGRCRRHYDRQRREIEEIIASFKSPKTLDDAAAEILRSLPDRK